jgi:hypothetical protein
MRPPRVSESGSLLRGSGGYAQMRVRRMSAPAFRGNRSLQHGSTDQNAEPAVAQILEQNALLTPDFFYDKNRGAARRGFALLQFVHRPLREPDSEGEFALAPVQHGTHHANLRREGTAFHSHDIRQISRVISSQVHGN